MKALRTCLLPAAMAVAQAAVWPGIALWRGGPIDRVEVAAGLTATLLAAIALAWRRHAPLHALAGVTAALTLGQLATPTDSLIVILFADVVALFSVGVLRPARASIGATAALLVWQAGLGLALYGPGREYVAGLLISVAAYLLAAGLGRSRRQWHAARQAAADRLARAEADRRQASLAERQRLARELHDVSAHHLTSIVVAMNAAQRLADRNPELEGEALDFAARTGRETLSALHRLAAVMRDVAPSFDGSLVTRVEELVARFVALGQPVTVRQALGSVDPTTAEAGFGIVREALTNALRHAPGAPVEVRLGHHRDALEILVENGAGTAPAAAATLGSGRGLPGMRERAAARNGTLEAGPLPGGGWRIRALLPATSPSTVDGLHHPVRRPRLAGVATTLAIPLAVALFPDPELPRLSAAGGALLIMLSAVHALPLLWRREAPWRVLCATLATTALWPLAVGFALLPPEALAFLAFGVGVEFVAVFAIATGRGPHDVTWLAVPLAAGVVAGALLAGAAVSGTIRDGTFDSGAAPHPGVVVAMWWVCMSAMFAVPLAAVYCAGFAVRVRRKRVLARERSAVAVSTAEAIHLAYVERARVAAGLRVEVLRHTGAVVTAAEQRRLDGVLESARTALAAMRDLLGDLRAEAALGPQPTAAAIEGLCQEQRAAGRDVELLVPAGPRSLPPAVDVSAYRVVETALGAGDRGPARVTVRYGDHGLRITITGVPTATADPVAVGLQSRVAALGGQMSAEPGGGTIDVWLPVRP